VIKVLWIEDKPKETDFLNNLFYQSGLITDQNLFIPTTFKDSEAQIDRAMLDYDLVAFDINLEDFPDIDEYVHELAEQFDLPIADFMKVAGFYLYQKLIRQGFPEKRIVFLTANTSTRNLFQRIVEELKRETAPERFQELLNELNGMISERDQQILSTAVSELQETGNHEILDKALDKILSNFIQSCSGGESYDKFEERFKLALISLSHSIHKGQKDSFHRWLKSQMTNENPDFAYITLRRGIIEGCRYLKARLERESDEWILFNKTTNAKVEKDYVCDYLSKLENFFPLNPPENAESLYSQFIKELSAEWEMSAGRFTEDLSNFDVEYRFKNNYERQMKLLRNWSSHGQIASDLCPKDAAFFFMIAMRAWFNLEFNQIMPYEKMLATIFDPVETLSNEQIKNAILKSYCDLKRFLENNKIYPDGNFFNQLLESIGGSLRKESNPDLKKFVAKNANRYFYQNLWHSIFPARLCIKNPKEGKDSILMIVNFERAHLQEDSFPFFLGKLIFNEAFRPQP